MEIIREQLEQTVYQLAKQISCKGWALEMEYQLLKNWACTIVVEAGEDWEKLVYEVSNRIRYLLERNEEGVGRLDD